MRVALAALTVALCAALAQQAPPARDAARPPTTGAGSISGIVVTDEATPRPVRRAVVTLAGDGLRPSRSAVTDDDGRFAIGGLPHGRFMLTAMRAGFVTSMFGARRPGRPGTALTLDPGEVRTDLVVRLWRGAVVAGVVRDVGGELAAGVPVEALPARGRASSGLLTLSNSGARTNERGQFRIFGLAPGSYLVVARVSGSGTPSVELAEAQMEAVLERLRRRSGPPPGPGAQVPPPVPSEPFSLAPVYYPGTTVVAQAQPIQLTAGQEVPGLDFTLQRLRTYDVTGVLRRDDGRTLAGTSVQLEAVRAPGPFASGDVARFRTAAGADGSFRFASVPPGDYRLLARAPVDPLPPSRFETTVQPGFAGATLVAMTDITLGGAPVTGLLLTLGSPLSMTGRVVFDGAPLEPATALARVQIAFLPPEMLAPGPGRSIDTLAVARPAAVQPDGTFRIDGIVPGVHAVGVMGPALATSGWWLRSAMLDGRDLADGHVDVTPGMNLSGVVVTFTDRHPELSGTLQTAGGEAVSDVFVIAYSADRSHWGPGTRRVQAVRPGIDGRYTIVGLPPGQYLLAALTDVDEGDWQDPAFLEQLVPGSIPIAIGEGERKVQDLRVGR